MTVHQPAVTVCIPTFNRRELLSRSLQSVLDQSLEDAEIIVSDNASTDDTEEYVRSIRDPRVRYDRLPTNIGLFGNLSRCLTLGTGRYRVMLPDDDSMLPGNLAAKVAFLDANPTAGMVHSAFRYLDDGPEPFGETQNWSRLETDTLEPGIAFLRRSLAVGGIVCVSSVMTRSSLVADERFDVSDGPYADIALWCRIASRSDVGFLTAPLSGYMVHDGSASSGFQLVRVSAGQHQMTAQHADATLQAHGRFVQRADISAELRTELAGIVAEADRRMRLTVLANRTIPPNALRVLKRAVGWGKGSALHRHLSLDGNTGGGPEAIA
ncbi:glycosyltransferase family 2 protein [Kineosporia sp. J2-2]|uniref:Glycosyltransferase family 2 protein n=1 Tax=Kineosporia corallincola TaxID=2835133 RepID=A0ABS5T8N4_9ACTN|nr:glycosyltransferase family 2 protein [Kineosporia corallincola]MBT0767431.1 glycosyltransferase family 2 protein [Kineosporia corallincola]